MATKSAKVKVETAPQEAALRFAHLQVALLSREALPLLKEDPYDKKKKMIPHESFLRFFLNVADLFPGEDVYDRVAQLSDSHPAWIEFKNDFAKSWRNCVSNASACPADKMFKNIEKILRPKGKLPPIPCSPTVKTTWFGQDERLFWNFSPKFAQALQNLGIDREAYAEPSAALLPNRTKEVPWDTKATLPPFSTIEDISGAWFLKPWFVAPVIERCVDKLLTALKIGQDVRAILCLPMWEDLKVIDDLRESAFVDEIAIWTQDQYVYGPTGKKHGFTDLYLVFIGFPEKKDRDLVIDAMAARRKKSA